MSTRQTVYGRTLTIVTERANHIYPKTDSSCSRSLSHGSNAMLGLKIYSVKPRLVIIFFLVRYVSLNLKKSEEKKKQSKWLHNGHFHGHTELCVLHFSYRKMANIHQHIPPTTIYIYFTCNFMITMSFAINSFNVRFFRAVLLIFLFQLDTVVVVYGVSEHFCGMHVTETI